jgi:hypothetical protein
MGYYQSLTGFEITISDENWARFLKDTRKLIGQLKCDTPLPELGDIGDTPTIEDGAITFDDIWTFVQDHRGCVDVQYDGEKAWETDFNIMRFVAPYIDDGGYIQMAGEGHDMWRWVFKNGEAREVSPTVVWPEM